MNLDLINEYTRQVLAFDWKNKQSETAESDTPDQETLNRHASRAARLVEKRGASALVLFGLGSGCLANRLAQTLPKEMPIIVCELLPQRVRELRDSMLLDTRVTVLTDTSAWAHLLLLAQCGITTENAVLILNPEPDQVERSRYQAMQRAFSAARSHLALNSSLLSHVSVQAPDLSVGAILSPDEPNLDDYFAQFPDWVREIVVIWDAEQIPDREFSCAAPIRHLAHPLDDFASQRNRMLDECAGEWVLYLDGDECFSPDAWDLLTALLLVKRLQACYFPRMTLYPEETRTKVGYGLWPDLQLRLFRNAPGIRFERPVHERLTNVTGRTAIAVDAPILHYSRIRKSPEQLAAKLSRFDQAGGNSVHHVLNPDYPSLKRASLAEASFISGALQLLLLEENPSGV